MAKKRSNIEPLTGVSLDSETKLTVQKSLPLFALWRSVLTLAEFKILDVYLSRIDSRNPDRRVVRFEKGELEKILGVKKINISELKERLKHLGTMVEVDDPTKTKSFRLISLFEQAECEQNEYGQWQVDLECTRKAMKYIFNVENLGYLRYKLRSIVNIKSRYSYILFLYLEQNRFRKTWVIGVDNLKIILNCENDDFYSEFRYFNQRILKRCQKELCEKTECKFTYETIKKGRSVSFIKFTLDTLPSIEASDPDQVMLENYYQDNDHIELLRSACCRSGTQIPEFSRAEMEQIFEVLINVFDSKLPVVNIAPGNINIQRYHYLAERYAAMNRIDEKNPIKNRFSYFLKMIKTDAGIE